MQYQISLLEWPLNDRIKWLVLSNEEIENIGPVQAALISKGE